MDDKDLTALLRKRDQRGMDELLRHYGPMLRYIIGGILLQPHDREECLNDVCLQSWEHIGSFDPSKGYFSNGR